MFIEEGNIIGYTWEVWYGGSCLHEDEEVFDTESEAEDAAKEFCLDRIEQWRSDGCEINESEIDNFKIVINDVIGEENYDDEE